MLVALHSTAFKTSSEENYRKSQKNKHIHKVFNKSMLKEHVKDKFMQKVK